MSERALITGSGGLVGSEAVRYFCARDFTVTGVDNDLRRRLFGPAATTRPISSALAATYRNFTWVDADIRDQAAMESVFRRHGPFDLILHAAAQPSHDWAARSPATDFAVNAAATAGLLELTRTLSPDAVFIFTSTNKVYGDHPNRLPLRELATRFDLPHDSPAWRGIDETMSVDQCLHSVFGASKLAADALVQEYGRYFGLKTGCFRGGCLTGPAHRGVELHGFLSHLARCVATGGTYRIVGYSGKQVRDSIHAADLIAAFDAFYRHPRPGEVYNIGGGRHSHCSLLEALALASALSRRPPRIACQPEPRRGDHIWYVSDLAKFQRHYPGWRQLWTLERTMEALVRAAVDDGEAAAA